MQFKKGWWYVHTEPGQEKFMIRVEDPEKQICSGWNCKGQIFKDRWIHLGNRLVPAKDKGIPNYLNDVNFETEWKKS